MWDELHVIQIAAPVLIKVVHIIKNEMVLS